MNSSKEEEIGRDGQMSLPTSLPGDLHEGLHTTLTVVSFRCQCGDVVPAQSFDNIQHGLSLVGVRRNHPREEVISIVVTELWSRGCIAHLRDLTNASEPLTSDLKAGGSQTELTAS